MRGRKLGAVCPFVLGGGLIMYCVLSPASRRFDLLTKHSPNILIEIFPKNLKNEDIDLDRALKFLSLPRIIGIHPESKKDIIASVGPYGPYLKHDNKFISSMSIVRHKSLLLDFFYR